MMHVQWQRMNKKQNACGSSNRVGKKARFGVWMLLAVLAVGLCGCADSKGGGEIALYQSAAAALLEQPAVHARYETQTGESPEELSASLYEEVWLCGEDWLQALYLQTDAEAAQAAPTALYLCANGEQFTGESQSGDAVSWQKSDQPLEAPALLAPSLTDPETPVEYRSSQTEGGRHQIVLLLGKEQTAVNEPVEGVKVNVTTSPVELVASLDEQNQLVLLEASFSAKTADENGNETTVYSKYVLEVLPQDQAEISALIDEKYQQACS